MSDTTTLLRAAHFAAARHRKQKRKGSAGEPYINHPIAVAELIASVGRVSDVLTLAAAILHDTVEDTDATLDDIEREFGADIRGIVAELTDDKSLPSDERKRLQVANAPNASRRAKIVKLADKSVNVADIVRDPPPHWPVTRRRQYVEWAKEVVAGCRGANTALEKHFDGVAAHALAAIRE
ncbi:MAG: HD domain-containing protein [Gemmatimonadaceae bacterium]